MEVKIPVASDSLNLAIVSSQGDVESNDSVAGLDDIEVLSWYVGLSGSSIEEQLDVL
jgi:hypothetical protein